MRFRMNNHVLGCLLCCALLAVEGGAANGQSTAADKSGISYTMAGQRANGFQSLATPFIFSSTTSGFVMAPWGPWTTGGASTSGGGIGVNVDAGYHLDLTTLPNNGFRADLRLGASADASTNYQSVAFWNITSGLQASAQARSTIDVEIVPAQPNLLYRYRTIGTPSSASVRVNDAAPNPNLALRPMSNGNIRVAATVQASASASGSASAHPVDSKMEFFSVAVTPLTPADVLTHSLSAPIYEYGDGGRMGVRSTFTPNYGLSLAEAAAICGVDHFNFLNLITEVPKAWTVIDKSAIVKSASDNTSNVLLIDPPPGGGQRAFIRGANTSPVTITPGHGGSDSNDSYYDDADVVNTQSALYQQHHLANSLSLTFSDSPLTPDTLLANKTGNNGETERFYTQLVGVDRFGRIVQLYGDSELGLGFSWYSNQQYDNSTGAINGGSVYQFTLLNDPGLPPVSGGSIYGAQLVPEPSALAVVLLGSAATLCRRRDMERGRSWDMERGRS